MLKDLININKEEIEESTRKIVDAIARGEYSSDLSDYYARKMLKEKDNNACRLGHKGPFLFIEDLSHDYASSLENKVYYRCICLECGKLDIYQMSRNDRNLLIKIDDMDYSIYSIDEIRNKYFELLNSGIEKEDIVRMMNKYYSCSKEKVKK